MTATHDHGPRDGAALSTAARAALESTGERWTPLRASVFDVLAAQAKPASAYDITAGVAESLGKRMAANSIYRILDIFVASNIARRVESANAYVVSAHPECPHDCIFLVCDLCGATTHIDDDRIAGEVRGSAEAAGFAPRQPVIEVRGTCSDCRS